METLEKTTTAMRTLLREWHDGRLPTEALRSALDRLVREPQLLRTHRLVIADGTAAFVKEEAC